MPSILITLWGVTFLVAVLFIWVRRQRRAGRKLWEPTPSEQAVEYAPERLRYVAGALLVCGLLLLGLGWASYETAVLEWQSRSLFGLMGAGGTAVLLAINICFFPKLSPFLAKVGQRFARFLNVCAWQVILVFFAPFFSLLAILAAGDQLLARHPTISLITWGIAVVCAVLGCWEWEDVKVLSVSRRTIWGTAVLFAIALFLRGSFTHLIPTTLSGDEGGAGLIALLFTTGEANNPFSFGWFSFPSLYFAVQSWGILLWGRTIEGLRITSAVAGAGAVVGAYWLGRLLFDRLTGWLTAVYLTASHYHIHVSRIGLNNVWDSLFGTLATLGLWFGWHRGKRSGFIFCGLALGLGQYFYVSIRVLPLLFLIWAGAAWLVRRQQFKERFSGLFVAGYVAFVVFLPLALLFLQHPNEFNAPLNRVMIFGDWLDTRTASGEVTAVEVVTDHMRRAAQGFTHRSLRLLYQANVPLLLSGAATLFLLGMVWGVFRVDLRYLLLFLPMVAVIILSGIGKDPPAAQRYILSMPMVAVVLVLPISQSVHWLQSRWPQVQRWMLVGVTAAMLWLTLTDLNFYFFKAYDTFILGGGNTETATHVANYLRSHEIEKQTVYFFGFPRMGFYGFGTIPYLAPNKKGIDMPEERLTAPPDWEVNQPTIFIFLPERLGELEFVEQAYPNGVYQEFFSNVNGQLLFGSYEVVP